MEYYFDINWEADKFYEVTCFIIHYSDTKHSELTYFRGSDSGGGGGGEGGERKEKKTGKKKQRWDGSPVLHFAPLFLSSIWRGYAHGDHDFC